MGRRRGGAGQRYRERENRDVKNAVKRGWQIRKRVKSGWTKGWHYAPTRGEVNNRHINQFANNERCPMRGESQVVKWGSRHKLSRQTSYRGDEGEVHESISLRAGEAFLRMDVGIKENRRIAQKKT